MSISVVIFSYNNPEGLKKCLESMLGQNVLPDEIIIIDNSRVFNSEVNGINNKIIQYVYNGHENAKLNFSIARNRGMELVSGEFVILAEDDAYYSSTFIQSIERQFKSGSDIISYRILSNFEFQNANWIEINNVGKIDLDFGLIDLGELEKTISSDMIFNSFAFRKEHYDKCKGWGADGLTDEYFYYNSGGEITLIENLITAGASKFSYAPGALMIHDKRETRLNNKYFFYRYAYWGAEDAYNYLKKNNIKTLFLIIVIKNIISLNLTFKKYRVTENSYLDKELLYQIRKYNFFVIIFHFLIFKRYRKIMRENWTRDWKKFDFAHIKPLKLFWLLDYKLYLNGKNRK